MRIPHLLMLSVCLLSVLSGAGCAAEVEVGDSAALRAAIASAKPGTRILLAPGTYEGGMYFAGVGGTSEEPVTIAGADAANPPQIVGGGAAFHFADATHLVLQDLILRDATGNGLNIDDGGSFDTPARGIILRRLTVKDVGPSGNRDGIKLSGVDDFRVEDCVIERWGDGGSAIDMVGCHNGLIQGCTFRGRDGIGGTGPQMKGGSSGIVVRGNRFEDAGGRAVNIGGSTGLEFFRPRPEGYEAKDITVEGNVIVGSLGAIAFVGVDGAVVRYNTIYLPSRWAIRILQETRSPDFVPCRNGLFSDNIVVFRSSAWSEGGCNIGPGTAPDTFRFERNLWYCIDRPADSRPSLPAPETDGVTGEDPLFVSPETGDFSLQADSPARGKGHTALPEPQ